VSQDPKGFAEGDTDLYRYVGNNPTGKVDTSGYGLAGGASGGVGGATSGALIGTYIGLWGGPVGGIVGGVTGGVIGGALGAWYGYHNPEGAVDAGIQGVFWYGPIGGVVGGTIGATGGTALRILKPIVPNVTRWYGPGQSPVNPWL
jgi:hypothetical protein